VQQTVRHDPDQPPPCRRQALWRFACQAHAHPHPLGPEILTHPQRHPQHHAARRERVIGDPIDQRAQFPGQRRHVELFTDVLETIMQTRIRISILCPYHRDNLARPERHRHHVAGLELHAARHAVGIGLVERDRHQHVNDTGRCGGGAVLARNVVHRRIGLGRIEASATIAS